MRIDRVHTVLLKFAGNHIACDNYVIWLCNSCKKMAYVEAIAALAIVLWLNYVRLCWNHRADRRRREITHSITLLEVLDFGPTLLPCPIIPSVCVLTSDCFVDGPIPSHPVQWACTCDCPQRLMSVLVSSAIQSAPAIAIKRLITVRYVVVDSVNCFEKTKEAFVRCFVR